MKELNQTVNKTVITNTRFFKMFTNASHIKKEEQIMATITITIELMGIITIIMKNYKYNYKYNHNYKYNYKYNYRYNDKFKNNPRC